MKIENWLYFRTVADEDDDDGDVGSVGTNPTSICIPASAIRQVNPTGTTAVRISFDSVIVADSLGSGMLSRWSGKDSILLTTTIGKTQEVIQALAEVISGNDQFTVIADDVTTNTANDTVVARYFHPDVTECSVIDVFQTQQGFGMHDYYEVVTPMTADDNDVAASLSISLPAQCILLEAAMVTHTLAGSNHGLVALEFHSAVIADDAASGGTEWLGADTLALTQREDNDNYSGTTNTVNNTSIPDADLDISSDAIANDTIYSGVADPIDRSTAVTHFHVTAKEDMSSMTGTPKVGVYIKWWGGPAVAL